MMTKFEDNLLADLMREHASELVSVRRTAAGRRVGRPAWVAAGALAVAAMITVGVNLAGTGTPAYAVSDGPDGTVTVSINKISGVDGANAELRRLGVRAVAVPMREDCTAPPPRGDARPVHFSGSGEASTSGIRFNPADIPDGDTMVLAARMSPGGGVTLSMDLIRGSAPACVTVPGAGRDHRDARPGATAGGSNTQRTAPAAGSTPAVVPSR
jgi:hypothetical protein